jgi:two-component system, sensor histidine kinase and response regulator
MSNSDGNPLTSGTADAPDNAAGFDLDRALERFAGDRELFVEMVESFFSDTPATLQRMRECLANNDYRELSRRAHSLKGAVAYFAVEGLSTAARHLEQVASQRDPQSAAAEAEVERQHALLSAALAPYRRPT